MTPEIDEKRPEPHSRFGRFQAKEVALLFFALLLAYGVTAFERIAKPSEHLHYIDLATSFLHGRLDTDTPRQTCRKGRRPVDDGSGYADFLCRHSRKDDGSWEGWNDWATFHLITLKDGTQLKGVWPWGDTKGSDKYLFRTFDGALYIVDKNKDLKRGCDPKRKNAACDQKKHFISFPPAPAVLMLPMVALFQFRFNDVVWTLVFAAAGMLALLMLLERVTNLGWSTRSRGENLWIAALCAVGTSFFFSAVRGEVWFTALIMGFFFNVLYLTFSLNAQRPVLAGAMLAIAMATRPPLAFGCLFFGFQLLKVPDRRKQLIKGLLFSAPILAVGIALMAYNWLRFESATEFGHIFLQEGMRPSIREHGLFSSSFFGANFRAAFGNLPRIISGAPFLQISRHGISIFAATPALLLLFWRWRPPGGKRSPSAFKAWHALIPLLCVATPALFYQNTGWAQYSYRFSVDYLPYLALLLACSGVPNNRLFRGLVVLSILISLFGAITFGRFPQFYYG